MVFPLFTDLSQKQVVVVGGGAIALRRLRTLLPFCGRITLISPEIHPEIRSQILGAREKHVSWISSVYKKELLQEPFLLLACTDDPILNRRICLDGKAAGALVNNCSDKTQCDFYFPGIAAKEPVVIGISASGEDHRLAKDIGNVIRKTLEEYPFPAKEKEAEFMKKAIVIGSRESALAVAQSKLLLSYLQISHPELEASLLTMKTTGDKILDRRLDQIGGKGLFVKELDAALLSGRTDYSVHSLKDLPMEIPDELPLLCYSVREDPRDVLILPEGKDEIDLSLPIGTSSLRRILQLKKLYPDARFESIRGNLNTRLRKLDEGQYGAIVLAAAGVKRLGLSHRISRCFSVEEVIPAAGQGILAIQGRASDGDPALFTGFADKNAEYCALAERAFVKALDGGCSSPVAAHAVIHDAEMTLLGLYYDEASGKTVKGSLTGSVLDAVSLGITLSKTLRGKCEK